LIKGDEGEIRGVEEERRRGKMARERSEERRFEVLVSSCDAREKLWSRYYL
jgi:hypothetical protein